jgi:hypothetical protein
MATKLNLINLIQLGFELCGTYSLPAHSEPYVAKTQESLDKGFVSCEALTNVKKLAGLISKLSGIHGHKRAMRALQFVADNSASPMETKLTMFLTLPYRLGGYGLPMPLLNPRIEGSSYRCDLFWPKVKLAVEYDSDQFHTGADRIARDSMRRNDLALLGITVVTVTRQQVRNSVRFRETATLLSKHLEKRLQFRDPVFSECHFALKALLIQSNNGGQEV